jgi:uncharacterized protein YaaR (DUF327 family)
MSIDPINSAAIGADLFANNFELQNISANSSKQNTAVPDSDLKNSKTENFFDRLLSRKLKPSQGETLQARVENLTKLGLSIRQHPMPALIDDYISNVQSLLTDVNDNAYGSQYKDKLFEKLEVLNSKLIQVADDFQQAQKPTIDIVASLGELQGLLIDIFV